LLALCERTDIGSCSGCLLVFWPDVSRWSLHGAAHELPLAVDALGKDGANADRG
jgi:hypothetical protein